jgi:hypothetical protein
VKKDGKALDSIETFTRLEEGLAGSSRRDTSSPPFASLELSMLKDYENKIQIIIFRKVCI